MWVPCWNGCDPQQIICGEAYDVCEVADPEPCIATCLCPPSSRDRPEVYLRADFKCVDSMWDCDCKYKI